MIGSHDQPSPLQPGRSPFVGRERQIAWLRAFLDDVATGSSTLVLVSGSPGVGKSRLLDEFSRIARSSGRTILRGEASQSEGMPPYLPFLTALGDYVRTASSERLREQLGSNGAILATLLPELPVMLGPFAEPYPLPSEQARYRLFEAVTAFLSTIETDAPPLILHLDDLQWADTATCELLIHIVSRTRARPLLVVAAARDGEAGANPAVAAAISELNRRRQLAILKLEALESDDTLRLARNLLGADVSRDLGEMLNRYAGGNPFFVEEIVRGLVEQRELELHCGRWKLTSGTTTLLPTGAVEAVQRRLVQLDDNLVRLLEFAAVAGRAFDSTFIAGASGLRLETVESQLGVAIQRGLVRRDVHGGFGFTHDMVREALMDRIDASRRQHLHQLVGEALESKQDNVGLTRLSDLALHFSAAGDKDRGVRYALASADLALRLSAAADAVTHYQTALSLLDPEENDPLRASALNGLGKAATLAGTYEVASAAFLEVQEVWQRLENSVAAARAWFELGLVRWRQESAPGALNAFNRALELLGSDDSPLAAETLLQTADLLATTLGEISSAIDFAKRGLAMSERLGDRRLTATAYCVLGNANARGNKLDVGLGLLERSLSLALELDDPSLAAQICAYLANVHAWKSDLDRSIDVSLHRADLAERSQDVFHLRHVYSWIGLQHVLKGEWSVAEQWFRQQDQTLDGVQSPEPFAALQLARAVMSYLRADFVVAEQILGDVIERLRPTASRTLIWYLGWHGLALAELNRWEDALARFDELESLVESIDPQARARGLVFAHLATGLARLGQTERCAGYYARLLPFQGQAAPVMIDRALGIAARAAGDDALARQHLLDVAEVTRRAGMKPELALTLLHLALLERVPSRGSSWTSPSNQYLSEGLQLCAELGMDEHARRTMGSEVNLLTHGLKRKSRVAGLSQRELEVLRLVVQGRTNREIAAALYLSENTVARHLTNIFNKIGVENRAGATAFALRNGLA